MKIRTKSACLSCLPHIRLLAGLRSICLLSAGSSLGSSVAFSCHLFLASFNLFLCVTLISHPPNTPFFYFHEFVRHLCAGGKCRSSLYCSNCSICVANTCTTRHFVLMACSSLCVFLVFLHGWVEVMHSQPKYRPGNEGSTQGFTSGAT